MAGETYVKRYAGGFVDGSGGGTAVDSQFLNAVETALLRLLGEDPAANEVPVWSTGSARFIFQKITNDSIDAAAAIDKTKLASLAIVNADVSGAAAIAQSKLALDIVNANVNASAAIASSKIAWGYGGTLASGSAVAVTPNSTHLLTGTTAVNTMTGGVTGCVVQLIASGQAAGICVVLNHATGANNLDLRDDANFGLYAGESMTFQFDGTKWIEIDRNFKKVLSYTEIQSDVNVTGTTEGTATAVISPSAITFDGATPIRVDVYVSKIDRGTSWITPVLYDGASIGLFVAAGDVPLTGAYETNKVFTRRLTPTNASHTYSFRCYVDAGTGTVRAGAGVAGARMPSHMTISRDI